jgi:hypothetical protein
MSIFPKKLIQITLILLVFFSISYISKAQESISNSISSIDLNISPSDPRAGESVVLTLSSDSLDLNSSKIVWYVDNVLKKESVGKSITIKTKNNGGKTTIKAVVETSDGIMKETSTDIIPAGVDLVIEPMSYVMPFYKGKPFFTKESTVKIIAMPDIIVNGVRVPAKSLNFKWSKDDNILGSNSGKGLNSIVVNSSIPVNDIVVGVEVSDDLGNVLAQTSKKVTLNDPQILFYEDSPLYGVLYNKVVNNYSLGTREELKIVAKPFSFSFLKDAPEEAGFAWYANGNSIASVGKTNEIILRQTTSGAKATASISLDVNNKNKISQFANNGFNVEFGQ